MWVIKRHGVAAPNLAFFPRRYFADSWWIWFPKEIYNVPWNRHIFKTRCLIHRINNVYNLIEKGVHTMVQWLANLINSNKFFTQCTKCGNHHTAREASLNFWDIDAQEELCSICLTAYQRDNVIQVGKQFWSESMHPLIRTLHYHQLTLSIEMACWYNRIRYLL